MTATTEAPTVAKLYTAAETLAVTGISYRRLDHWCRAGYLDDTATGSGSRRMFTEREVDLIYAVRGLTRAGFNVQPAFDIARRLIDDDRFVIGVGGIWELAITVKKPEGNA